MRQLVRNTCNRSSTVPAGALASWSETGVETDAVRLGAIAERCRIAQDLHDDVIPPLLSFIYRADDIGLADEGRRLLRGLREILRQLDGGTLA